MQINGYVQCGKLKNAYLVAIKAKLVDEVQKISEIAFKAGQLSVRDICEKWLQSNNSVHRWVAGYAGQCSFHFCILSPPLGAKLPVEYESDLLEILLEGDVEFFLQKLELAKSIFFTYSIKVH